LRRELEVVVDWGALAQMRRVTVTSLRMEGSEIESSREETMSFTVAVEDEAEEEEDL
jgi:hypothetical protein